MGGRHAGALLLALALACDGGIAGPPPPPRADQSGVRYVAQMVEAGPEILAARLLVENRSATPRTVRFPDRCVALFRLHFPDGRIVWDQFDPEKRCQEPPVELALAPGEERVFDPAANAGMVLLGESLPSGPYRVTLYMRPEGEPPVELTMGTFELRRADVGN